MNSAAVIDLLLTLILLAHVGVAWRLSARYLPIAESVLQLEQRNYIVSHALLSAAPIVLSVATLNGALLWRAYHLLNALGAWGGGAVVLLSYVGILAGYYLTRAALFYAMIQQTSKLGLLDKVKK